MIWRAIQAMPREAVLYEGTLYVLAVSFILYALIMKRLLALIGKNWYWYLPLIGSMLLIFSAMIHGFTVVLYNPVLKSDPEIFRESIKLRTVSLACFMGCGLCAAISGLVYYRSMGEK